MNSQLTIASKGGPKLDLAREMKIADEYITISDAEPRVQMEELAAWNPYGFDIVIEATGSPTVLEASLDYVRKGGKLVVYGVYDDSVKISWSPFRICKSNPRKEMDCWAQRGRLPMSVVLRTSQNLYTPAQLFPQKARH